MINRYKIAIVEPAPLLLAGVKALLEESGEFEVAYVFNTLHGYDSGRRTFSLMLL